MHTDSHRSKALDCIGRADVLKYEKDKILTSEKCKIYISSFLSEYFAQNLEENRDILLIILTS